MAAGTEAATVAAMDNALVPAAADVRRGKAPTDEGSCGGLAEISPKTEAEAPPERGVLRSPKFAGGNRRIAAGAIAPASIEGTRIMTEHIPLNKLILSPRNVRRTDRGEDIEGLADSIRSKGLLHNLVVSETVGGKLFEVDDGGRRLLALERNAKAGHIPRNWPVPCVLVPRADAREASLAANIQRIAMNPADEVEAYAAIIGDYEENGIETASDRIANCSRRFGQTENYVRQRLRLADLAPDILAALRSGAITIKAAEAYATHPDHKIQMKVFAKQEASFSEFYKHRPRDIRDALNGKVYPVDHRLVRYVGLDAYREAGGRTEADLFFGIEDEAGGGAREQLLDPAIIDRLAREKAAAAAQALAQAEGWLDAEIAKPGSPSYAEPPPPKGYQRCGYGSSAADVAPADRENCIAAFRLTEDGEIAALDRVFFRPKREAEAEPAAGSMSRDWEAERREDDILLRAARLAAPKVTGTPLEGCAFWPTGDSVFEGWVEEIDDDHVATQLIVKIPKADLEAHRAEAEREYEEAQAKEAEQAEQAEQAAASADDDTAGDEPEDAGDAETPADAEKVAA